MKNNIDYLQLLLIKIFLSDTIIYTKLLYKESLGLY